MGRLFNDSEDGGIIVMAIATILTFTAVPLAAYLFPYVSSLFPDDEDEPRSIPSKVPFVGHLIGMVQHGPSYCGNITRKCKLPIYSLYIPLGRIYVVNSPALISAIDRKSRAISFAPYVVQFAKKILSSSQRTIDLLAEDLLENNGPVGLRPETRQAVRDSLSPGDDLESLSCVMMAAARNFLNSTTHTITDSELNLFDWTRRLVTRVSTDAVYGPTKNPFHDETVYNGFWEVDKGFHILGLNIFPTIFARKATRGRSIFFKAMKKYYSSRGFSNASKLIQARYDVNKKFGVAQQDIERFDLSLCSALLFETVPGTAWVLYHLYSRPDLLSDVRTRVEDLTRRETVDKNSGAAHFVINIPAILESWPLLISLIKEVLRLHSTNSSGRIVLQDTIISQSYLLKRDALLFIPSEELHKSKSVWGPTALEFDPERFVKNKHTDKSAHKVPAAAYRAFGSGYSACPGRYFALHEIATIILIMVMKYDLTPVDGKWAIPGTTNPGTTRISTPLKDIKLRLNKRNEMENKRMEFIWDSMMS